MKSRMEAIGPSIADKEQEKILREEQQIWLFGNNDGASHTDTQSDQNGIISFGINSVDSLSRNDTLFMKSGGRHPQSDRNYESMHENLMSNPRAIILQCQTSIQVILMLLYLYTVGQKSRLIIEMQLFRLILKPC